MRSQQPALGGRPGWRLARVVRSDRRHRQRPGGERGLHADSQNNTIATQYCNSTLRLDVEHGQQTTPLGLGKKGLSRNRLRKRTWKGPPVRAVRLLAQCWFGLQNTARWQPSFSATHSQHPTGTRLAAQPRRDSHQMPSRCHDFGTDTTLHPQSANGKSPGFPHPSCRRPPSKKSCSNH